MTELWMLTFPPPGAAGLADTASAVGSTSSMIQGWRPYSATNQPVSAAIQGSGWAGSGYPDLPADYQDITGLRQFDPRTQQLLSH